MSKIRVNEIETLDGTVTKDIASLIDNFQDEFDSAIDTLTFTTSTGEQSVPNALDSKERLNNTITPEVFGAVGDGVADDTSPVMSAFSDGRAVSLKRGATYRVTSGQSVSNFLSLRSNGASIELDFSIASPSSAFTFEAGSNIDTLRFTVPTGQVIDRVVRLTGSAVHNIGSIEVTSVDQQDNRAALRDAAIGFESDGNIIGKCKVENFDNPYYLAANELNIDALIFNSYVRGVWLNEISDFKIAAIMGRVSSPNAQVLPGHNGLLISQSVRGSFGIVDIEDAGEHGVRYGGGSTDGSSDIHTYHLRAHNSGGCGLKFRCDENQRTRRVRIDSVSLSDSGIGPEFGPNEEGLLIERTLDISIGHLHVFAVNQGDSCARGLRVNNTDGLYVASAHIDACEDNGIFLENTDDNGTNFRNLTNIDITANINNSGGDAILVNTDNIDLRHIYIKANVRGAGDNALHLFGAGTFVTQSRFQIHTDDHSGSPAVNVSGSITAPAFLDIDVFDVTNPIFYRPTTGGSGIIRSFKSDVTSSYTTHCVVRDNGNLENTNNSYGALSDFRIKDNISDINDQWDDIKNLRPRKFFNKLSGTDQIGLVAQEVKDVSPGLVATLEGDQGKEMLQSAHPESTEEEIEELLSQGDVLSIKYSVLNIKLLKVVQSLQERVEELERANV